MLWQFSANGKRDRCLCYLWGKRPEIADDVVDRVPRVSWRASPSHLSGRGIPAPHLPWSHSRSRSRPSPCRERALTCGKLVAGADLNPRPLGYETTGPRLHSLIASIQSSSRAALRAAASHRVSGGAACPRRLYYIRYYTRAAISTSQPTRTPIRRRKRIHHSAPRTRDVVTGHAPSIAQIPIGPGVVCAGSMTADGIGGSEDPWSDRGAGRELSLSAGIAEADWRVTTGACRCLGGQGPSRVSGRGTG